MEVEQVAVWFTRAELVALLGRFGPAQYGPREELASIADKALKALKLMPGPAVPASVSP